jgi:hypothetical protein
MMQPSEQDCDVSVSAAPAHLRNVPLIRFLRNRLEGKMFGAHVS